LASRDHDLESQIFFLFMKNQEEIWKSVNGYEGFYLVSSLGSVKSIKRNLILKPFLCKHTGYLSVNLRCKSFRIHVLVANAFLEKTKTYVNHKDLNKTNNYLSNLEFVTSRENANHEKIFKGYLTPGISNINNRFQVRIRIMGIKTYFGKYDTLEEAIKIRDEVCERFEATRRTKEELILIREEYRLKTRKCNNLTYRERKNSKRT